LKNDGESGCGWSYQNPKSPENTPKNAKECFNYVLFLFAFLCVFVCTTLLNPVIGTLSLKKLVILNNIFKLENLNPKLQTGTSCTMFAGLLWDTFFSHHFSLSESYW